MSDDTDFEWVTNPTQLAPPPPLRRKRVEHPAIRHTNGKVARFYISELSQYGYGEYQKGLRVYKPDGSWTVNSDHSDLRLLAECIEDANGNRWFPTQDAAIAQLGKYGKSVIDALVEAVNEVHGDVDESSKSAEGNSTLNGSTPSTSPTTSDSQMSMSS